MKDLIKTFLKRFRNEDYLTITKRDFLDWYKELKNEMNKELEEMEKYYQKHYENLYYYKKGLLNKKEVNRLLKNKGQIETLNKKEYLKLYGK